MNKTTAYAILELDINSPNIDIDQIKRQYRLKALIYHPDKNNSPNASSKFQEIHDAYEYVLREEGYMDANCSDDSDMPNYNNHNMPSGDSYRNIFLIFLKKILENEAGHSIFYNIIQRLTTLCESKAIELLERLDKPTLIKTRNILSKYKDAFHVSDNIISKISTLIQTRNETDEYIILNPVLKDLYENNLYKLSINGELYIIPLWHHELVYENNGHDIYVNCLPDLPNHINIDENNNIHVEVHYNMHDIWGKDYIYVECESKKYPVQVNTLKLTGVQTIIFAKQGISKINTKSIYDVSCKSDVHITIHISM